MLYYFFIIVADITDQTQFIKTAQLQQYGKGDKQDYGSSLQILPFDAPLFFLVA